MKVVADETASGVDQAIELCKELTTARTNDDSFAIFVKRICAVRELDLLVGLIPEQGLPGAYRLDYCIVADQQKQTGSVKLRHLHRGGVLGELLELRRAAVVKLDPRQRDNVLGDLIDEMKSCVLIPIYVDGRVVEWAAAFSTREGTFGAQELCSAILDANFMTIGQTQRLLVEENRVLAERLDEELARLGDLQRTLLPSRPPPCENLEIVTSYVPSANASGDAYDFFQLPDGKLGMLIADVSGHGADAAAVISMLHAILSSPERPDSSPSAMLVYANDRIMRTRLRENFVAAVMCVYDPATRDVTYANCGHVNPRLVRRDGTVETLDARGTLPLGITHSIEPGDHTIRLGISDAVVLCTDGIPEARDRAGELFGERRLDALLRECAGDPPDTIVQRLLDRVRVFLGDAPNADDQTLVVFGTTEGAKT